MQVQRELSELQDKLKPLQMRYRWVQSHPKPLRG